MLFKLFNYVSQKIECLFKKYFIIIDGYSLNNKDMLS